eukprot:CAMPEP_0119560804 /NCGR_PEP_ID=MMETSP1352-20130426/15912_1 /TAXON_ID=265584 /ORGANISM="Stauroneis constricta, Strain CCMP1120" /LENGTH=123 /DNA_ID=CAMNT_0007608861 /DNA_START=51 /DNA_END=422 /DNA_ORIENTATION=-
MISRQLMTTLAVAVATTASSVAAFAPTAFAPRSASRLAVGNEGIGGLEQIEFKIYPDGRVEEIVRGVKGGDCQKITESLNKMLGEVISSEPTEEMFEQKLVVDQTLTENVDNDSSGWDGQSTW